MPSPNLFLIGAPKCGTTSVAQWLSERDDIFLPIIKEQDYFNKDHNNSDTHTLEAYLKYYVDAPTAIPYCLDGSIWYLYSSVAVPAVLEFCPAAKFIVVLRNPVEMAYSLHDQLIFSEFDDVEDFEVAWNLQPQRLLGEKIPRRCPEPKFLQYKEACSLGKQLDRLYQASPREKVFVIFTEDLKSAPRKVWVELMAFLGLEDDGRVEFRAVNAAHEVRSILLRRSVSALSVLKRKLRIGTSFGVLNTLVRANLFDRERPSLAAPFRSRLVEEFREDVLLLQNLTGRDLSHWLRA
jgi:hypothetical protein